jgi:hypothetical protein
VDLITPDQLIPQPREVVLRHGTPDTIAGWKALADGLLTNQSCVFHRNLEISSRYAWIYKFLPAYFKWAGMAAFASHHVRLALFPLRLDRDRTGYVDIPHSLGRRKVLLIADVNTIRKTNNAIFDDILWVHLAYAAAEDGIECLRALLRAERHYAPVLSGFEAIDRGRRVLEDRTATAEARRAAEDLIWEGNVLLLEHEQRALVQPNLDGLSCPFARLFSIGSALSFEVRGRRGLLLHLVLLLRAHRRHPASPPCAGVAADHPLRRPLALDRDVHRPPLPETRRPHAPGRRQSAPRLRRSARLRVEPLRPTAFTALEPGLRFSCFAGAIRACPPPRHCISLSVIGVSSPIQVRDRAPTRAQGGAGAVGVWVLAARLPSAAAISRARRRGGRSPWGPCRHTSGGTGVPFRPGRALSRSSAARWRARGGSGCRAS